jgi:hypothetical protein
MGVTAPCTSTCVEPSELTWCIELDEGVLVTIHILHVEEMRDTVLKSHERRDSRIFITKYLIKV